MSTPGHPWKLVSWDLIQPLDVVQAPDESEWTVAVRLDFPDDPEVSFLLTRVTADGATEVWSDRARTSQVLAWRYSDLAPVSLATERAIGRIRLAGVDATEIRP